MLHTAIILAGGFGTRLQSVVSNVPKPMAPVNGLPFLTYQLRFLKHFGIKNIIFSVGHLHEIITAYYKNEFEGLTIDYVIEEKPLGTGGGIKLAIQKASSEIVLALNGDSFFDFDLNQFYNNHLLANSLFSLALRQVPDASRYGTILTDQNNRIISFKEKNGLSESGIINAGIYILNKEHYLLNTSGFDTFSIEKDFFEKQCNHLAIKGFKADGYFIDIGIPEDYNKAQNDFKEFKY